MYCPKCEEPIEEADIHTDIAAHDEDCLDIVVECNACGSKYNGFISIDQMTEVEK